MNCVGDYSVIVSRTANFIFKDEWLLNTEKDHIDEPSNMFELLEEFDVNKKKQLIIVEDLVSFDSKLDAQAGNPTIKKKSLAKLIENAEHPQNKDVY